MTTTLTLSPTHASTVQDFFELLKPRVMSLVVFTAAVGLGIAPGAMHPFLACMTILCIALGAGAAGALNMWYDRDIDAIMVRTATRPIPSGRIAPDDALTFGLVLSFFSVFFLDLVAGWKPTLFLAFSIFFYVVIYTMYLKRRTVQNIVIGGAAGAFPPMIGWLASAGTLSLEPIMLFLMIFLWTPPHFWALSLYQHDDYKRANVPMMPVVYGAKRTKIEIVVYTIALVIGSLLYPLAAKTGVFYVGTATILGVMFLAKTIVLLRSDDKKEGLKVFFFSIFYLFTLFLAIFIDHRV